jgi:nitrous oxidase accessory protein
MADQAIVLYDSSHDVRFEGNAFVSNFSPLWLVGRRTDTVFQGNYWSDSDEPDLDGDGTADRPYRVSNVFDHLRGNMTAADLMARGVAAAAVSAAERTFPVLDLVPVLDQRPLARPPYLPDVPSAPQPADRGGDATPWAAWCLLGAGLGLVATGRRSLLEGSR